jgi:hypothetical protein
MHAPAFGERLIALFLLGALAFSPAFLHIVRSDVFVLGLPLFYLYLFVAWAVLIAVAAVLVGRGGNNESSAPGRPHPGPPED